MATQLFFALSQQYMQACNLGRQAAFLEVQGNLPGATQLLANASAQLDNIITTAQQYRMPVLEGVFFTAAYLHYNAARLALMTGWLQNAPMHLYYAECALNQAIQINPNFAPYHASAGMVEIARQNVPEAIRAFTRAVQLNPMDAFSQYMLSALNVNQATRSWRTSIFKRRLKPCRTYPRPR
jgi:tetratricopeptide (TPR) repeat protein